MENKEDNCCEKKKEECCAKMHSSKCCIHKYHLLKIIVLVIIIITAFCFGSFFSRMHSFRNGSYGFMNNGYMMDGDYDHGNNIQATKSATGEVTVDVK